MNCKNCTNYGLEGDKPFCMELFKSITWKLIEMTEKQIRNNTGFCTHFIHTQISLNVEIKKRERKKLKITTLF